MITKNDATPVGYCDLCMETVAVRLYLFEPSDPAIFQRSLLCPLPLLCPHHARLAEQLGTLVNLEVPS
jgi:hypothetical protein